MKNNDSAKTTKDIYATAITWDGNAEITYLNGSTSLVINPTKSDLKALRARSEQYFKVQRYGVR